MVKRMSLLKVLLSIKPEYVSEIALGTKTIEYRKRIFKRTDISTVLIYATKPCGKIIGEFEIEKIIRDHPTKLWQKTKNYSTETKESFDAYFRGQEIGYGIQIKNIVLYDKPLSLKDYKIKAAPQSFCYIKE